MHLPQAVYQAHTSCVVQRRISHYQCLYHTYFHYIHHAQETGSHDVTLSFYLDSQNDILCRPLPLLLPRVTCLEVDKLIFRRNRFNENYNRGKIIVDSACVNKNSFFARTHSSENSNFKPVFH